jgi:chemotaxis protein MotB
MARRSKPKKGQSAAWLITFSDLMTLLLTFFVLLLSMSSMDTTMFTRISAHLRSLSAIPVSGPGRVPERLEIVTRLLKDPQNILEKRNRLKDLLFPLDLLPKELSPGELEKNLSILEHPEGVVIVLTQGLLFSPGSSSLNEKGKKLLDALTPVIFRVNADVNISGHSAALAENGADGYNLSFLRAAVVLEHFLHAKLSPDRFSVSGYGPDKPMYDGGAEEQEKNRRVEILVKTAPRVGSYME